MKNMRHLLACVTVLCLLGCTPSTPEPAIPRRSLTHFKEPNFGVRFSHTAEVSTFYNPHGGADRVMMAYQEKPIGGLLIRPAPPTGSIKEFIAAGKEHYRRKYGATSVDYAIYENPHRYKFHHIKAEAPLQGSTLVVECFIHLNFDSYSLIHLFKIFKGDPELIVFRQEFLQGQGAWTP